MVPTTRRTTAAGLKDVPKYGPVDSTSSPTNEPPLPTRCRFEAEYQRGRPCASYTKSVAKIVSPCSRMFTPHPDSLAGNQRSLRQPVRVLPNVPSRAAATRPHGEVTPNPRK